MVWQRAYYGFKREEGSRQPRRRLPDRPNKQLAFPTMATVRPTSSSSPDPSDFLALSSADDILSALGGAVWAPPVSTKVATGPNAIPLVWGDCVTTMAEKLGSIGPTPFVLPASLPPRHPYSRQAGLLAMPPSDLQYINSPIPSARGSQRRPTLNLLVDIINGQYNGKAIPNMAAGEELPLTLVLGILMLNGEMYQTNSFLRTLWDGRHASCLLGALARVSNRFVICDHRSGNISLVQDFYKAD